MKTLSAFFEGNRRVYLREEELPDPRYNEIQVKTLYNGICMAEVYKYRDLTFPEPMRPGHEGIAVVTKVGSEVRDVREGDLVTATYWARDLNLAEGTYLPLGAVPEAALRTHLVEPLSCIVTAVDELHLYPGDRVAVFGAGYMGLLLIQLLRRCPISRLTVVDMKEQNLALARKFGATETILLGTEDGEARLAELAEEMPFDAAYECSGAQAALTWCEKLLGKAGKLGVYGWHHGARQVDGHIWHTRGLSLFNVSPWIIYHKKAMTPFLAAHRLMQEGLIDQRELVTHEYAFEDIERAMEESTARQGGFLKSVLRF